MLTRRLLRCFCLAFAAICLALPAMAQPVLRRGVNITGWFRFPVSHDPAVLARYMTDSALDDLRAAGFDFVRLAIAPDLVDSPALLPAIRRLQAQGLTVVISPHPNDWRLETDPAPLRAFWSRLAPRLRGLTPAATVPEIVNEPVFPNDPKGWANLQHRVLLDIRQSLPDATIVLTGADWSSIRGLEALVPENDPRVVYSFHFYDPPELTALAAYRNGLDRRAIARLPFPADDNCVDEAGATDPVTSGLIAYYCNLRWTTERIARQIGRAANWAAASHVRLLAGEFGASADLNRPARLAWLKAARSAFEANAIGWAIWGYDDSMGFNVPRPPGPHPRLDGGILTALGMAPAL